MSKKKFFPTAMLMILLAAMPWTQLITSAEGFPKKTNVARHTPHTPILITCNADFTVVNGVTGGSGMVKDPFLIEGWNIDGDGYDCIHIKDTNAFFVIKNVWVHNGQFGIMLKNMTNGAINNSTITDNEGGIRIWNSSNNIITGNELFSNIFYGITVDESSNNTVSGNNLSSNRWGIIMSTGFNNTITGNNASSNDNYGILLYKSSNNNISGNNVTANGSEIAAGSGIMLHYGFENIVYGNNVSSNQHGFYLSKSANNTISCNHVLNNDYGIIPYSGSKNIVSGNNASSNKYGLYLYETSNNTIMYNDVFNNEYGIVVDRSSNNTISGNNVSSNKRYGIKLLVSTNNLMYHNNFVHNRQSAYDNSANLWDNDYPSGGNYWSNYTGVDVDGDCVGDTPRAIKAKNQDWFPLMGPFSVFEAGTWNEVTYRVEVASNSTVSDFDFSPDNKAISFKVSGPDRTMGFCRVTILNTFLGGPYDVLVNGTPPLTLNEQFSGNNTFIHFTYSQSTKRIEIMGTTIIIPKSPSVIIPPYTFIVIILVLIISIIVILTATILKREIKI